MIKFSILAIATSAALVVPGTAAGQAKHYPLESTDGIRLHNVIAEAAVLAGKKGLRVRGAIAG